VAFQSLVYFSDRPTRAEFLSELLYFEGIQVQLVSDPQFLPSILRKDPPRLLILDHDAYRRDIFSLVREARMAAGDSLVILPVIERERLSPEDIEMLKVDSIISPDCDDEALHCTVKRLMFSQYNRWERRAERLPIEHDIPFSARTALGPLSLRPMNLNITGAELLLKEGDSHPFRPDQLIHLEAQLPEATGTETAISIRAITRWVSSHTLGVEFYDFNRQSLKNLIDLSTKEATAKKRENESDSQNKET
jgi:CheY-like chemotaxis protein